MIAAPPEEQKTVAEATAYSVCAAFGVDVGSYSFRYIAGWCKREDGAEILDQVMHRTAKAVKCIVAGAAAKLEIVDV